MKRIETTLDRIEACTLAQPYMPQEVDQVAEQIKGIKKGLERFFSIYINKIDDQSPRDLGEPEVVPTIEETDMV